MATIRKKSVACIASSGGLPTVGIVGKGTLTYLYINGLRVAKSIKLSKAVTIMPVRNRCNFRKAVLDINNEVIKSYFVLLEHNINAQFRIVSASPREECIQAFNAQWDALLLSAILNCYAISNIQGDVPIEKVSRFDQIRLTNIHLFGVNSRSHTIGVQDSQWISEHYEAALKLMRDNRFMNAVHAMASYKWHTLPSVQLAILWSGIEALFGIKSELSFRLAVCIAKFLHGSDNDAAKKKCDEIKSLYSSRSAAVHGGALKGEPSKFVQQSAAVLHALIRKCAENKGLPDEKQLLFA